MDAYCTLEQLTIQKKNSKKQPCLIRLKHSANSNEIPLKPHDERLKVIMIRLSQESSSAFLV